MTTELYIRIWFDVYPASDSPIEKLQDIRPRRLQEPLGPVPFYEFMVSLVIISRHLPSYN